MGIGFIGVNVPGGKNIVVSAQKNYLRFSAYSAGLLSVTDGAGLSPLGGRVEKQITTNLFSLFYV